MVQKKVTNHQRSGPYDIRSDLDILMKYAMKIASTLAFQTGRDDLEQDFRQEALIGALKATKLYDEGQGASFPTYAWPRMEGAAKRFALRATTPVHVPEHIQLSDVGPSAYSVPLDSDTLDQEAPHLDGSDDVHPVHSSELQALMSFVKTLPEVDQDILRFHFGLEDGPVLTRSAMWTALGLRDHEVAASVERSCERLRGLVEDFQGLKQKKEISEYSL